MDRPRWEILVLAAAILVGAWVIASSVRANRYVFNSVGANDKEAILSDTHTGEVYAIEQRIRETRKDNPELIEWKAFFKPVK